MNEAVLFQQNTPKETSDQFVLEIMSWAKCGYAAPHLGKLIERKSSQNDMLEISKCKFHNEKIKSWQVITATHRKQKKHAISTNWGDSAARPMVGKWTAKIEINYIQMFKGKSCRMIHYKFLNKMPRPKREFIQLFVRLFGPPIASYSGRLST